MSTKAAPVTTNARSVQQIIQLFSSIWAPEDPPTGLDSISPEDLILLIFKKVMLKTGQTFVKWALILLNGPLGHALNPEMVRQLNDKLVGVIYNHMPHPPENLSGFDFRSANGADYLGAAGMPYARSVTSKADPDRSFPDAKDVFDKLLKRRRVDGKETFVPNGEGLSSLTFAYGTLVIHSVFNTALRSNSPTINQSSSYFDLSPLYGDNIEQQLEIRNRAGRGYLLPDCFADNRMLFLPPAAAVLLVLFNRNHNYIAKQLLEKEGEGRWVNPPPYEDAERCNRQDEEIFQTARLINCYHFVNVVITDYVGGLMGRTKGAGGWPMTAEPFDHINIPDMDVGRGEGNLVSIEFNVLYRWHSTLSEKDTKWAEDFVFELLGSQESRATPQLKFFDNLKREHFVSAMLLQPDLGHPKDRTFAGLVRNKDNDNRFDDEDLAKILYDATEAPAGVFRACGSPAVMQIIDVRGIEWARQVKMCTFNEFREWLGLPKYKDFSEWNAEPSVAQAAKELYGNIDNLELLPGLHSEGNADDGFNQSYPPFRANTMRNGLLFDAIALIRGDRFFTTAYTEENYTSWGYNDVQRDPNNKAFGGQIHKLLFRTLPDHFPTNSVYSWFPLSLPQTMKQVLDKNEGWVFSRP